MRRAEGRHREREREANGARVIDEPGLVDPESALKNLGEHRQVQRRVAPVTEALMVGAVETEDSGEGLRALARHLEPLFGLGMAALKPNRGELETAERNDLQVVRVENQRPAA